MKIWEIFFSKVSALLLVIFIFSIIISTVVVIESLIIFNDNIFVTKLLFINLYIIFLVPLFVFSLNLLIVSLNLQKISLIFSSFFMGLMTLFYLINAVLYEFKSDSGKNGSNLISSSEYNFYLRYYIKTYEEKNKKENKIISDLVEYSKNSEKMKNLIHFDNLESLNLEESRLKDYYFRFITDNSFYSSGDLFSNIDLFNEFNKTYLIKDEYYREAKYDASLIENNLLFKELYNFKDTKNENDIFEYNDYKNLKKSSTYLHELNSYINKLENYFKINNEINSYYFDLKSINKLILEIYKKGFYFTNQILILSNSVGRNNSNIVDFLKAPFNEKIDYIKNQKILFNMQKTSSAKLLYQGILFYLVNNWNYEEPFTNNTEQPDSFTLSSLQMANYYTSPFLWLEFLSKFGLVDKTFDNITTIESAIFYKSNNFYIINNSYLNNKYIIKDYVYEGPNTALMIFLILIFNSILVLFAYSLYRFNFYK
ncbi:hypothetical protein [Spiroplasma tabanidicola]|uniref:ABC transporter permease n=1 Tax=Spiroplasma tabanidicola TaxID=324079 RepID=A0A6I6CCT2_9MOLU|nr:hypothetical protein [Spiroplasma tabanidicola]QGS51774.1 ABC transporter permease [Spiroplasma tabanidicola]